MTGTSWNAELYEGGHAFVWKLADEVFRLLAPATD